MLSRGSFMEWVSFFSPILLSKKLSYRNRRKLPQPGSDSFGTPAYEVQHQGQLSDTMTARSATSEAHSLSPSHNDQGRKGRQSDLLVDLLARVITDFQIAPLQCTLILPAFLLKPIYHYCFEKYSSTLKHVGGERKANK